MLSVGERLRRARLDQGLQIDDLSTSTKISARFLEAIESDRRDRIPAGFFFRQWTMQYAHALAVDPAEIQDGIDRVLNAEPPLPLPGQLQAESKDLPIANRDSYRTHGTPRTMLSIALLVIVVLGCSGFYAWWHKRQQNGPPPGLTQSASSVPSASRPAELAPTKVSQPEKTTVAELKTEQPSVLPGSQVAAERILPKRAAAASFARPQADAHKLSRRRLRAKRLRRASSRELRAERRGE